MNLFERTRALLDPILDAQYRRSDGWLGFWVGQRMAKDHLSENHWTVRALRPQPADQLLEIGFGTGVAMQAVAGFLRESTLHGVDFSWTMVMAARTNRGRGSAGWLCAKCRRVY